jgi:nucleotide sugar dehydrogenase
MKDVTEKSRFTVIGTGFVGTAVINALSNKYEILKIDPPKGEDGDPIKYINTDGVVICVPTPADSKGKCDDSLVTYYIERIRYYNPTVPILIKSTTDIKTLSNITETNITFSPEFLLARNANEDFLNQDFAVFGGDNGRFWYEIFKDVCVIKQVRFTDITTAGFVKYTINSFLAMKVVFFNELFHLFNKSAGLSFDSLTEIVSMDDRIGNSHLQVPGPDGDYGFGGACFPKDTKAFVQFAKDSGPLELLEHVIKLNNEIRN